MKPRHLGLRVDDLLHEKLRYIAEREGRSLNGQIRYLLHRGIFEFEKTHGKIEETQLQDASARRSNGRKNA